METSSLEEKYPKFEFPYFTAFSGNQLSKTERINKAHSLLNETAPALEVRDLYEKLEQDLRKSEDLSFKNLVPFLMKSVEKNLQETNQLHEIIKQVLGVNNGPYWEDLLNSRVLEKAACLAQFENVELAQVYQKEQNASLLKLIAPIQDQKRYLLVRSAYLENQVTIPHLQELTEQHSQKKAEQFLATLLKQVKEEFHQAKYYASPKSLEYVEQLAFVDQNILLARALVVSEQLEIAPACIWNAYKNSFHRDYYDGTGLGNPNVTYLSFSDHQKVLTRIKQNPFSY